MVLIHWSLVYYSVCWDPLSVELAAGLYSVAIAVLWKQTGSIYCHLHLCRSQMLDDGLSFWNVVVFFVLSPEGRVILATSSDARPR